MHVQTEPTPSGPGLDGLVLRPAETPNLVRLDTLGMEFPNVLIVPRGGNRASVRQQAEDRDLRAITEAGGRVDAVPLDKSPEDRGPLLCAELPHAAIMLERSGIVKRFVYAYYTVVLDRLTRPR